MNHADRQSTPTDPKPLTSARACPRCPRCRSYIWTVIKVSASVFGRYVGQEICCACLLAILTLEV